MRANPPRRRATSFLRAASLALSVLPAALGIAGVPDPATAPAPVVVPIPGGEGGIGMDDLRFAPRLGKVLVPAGRTGSLYLLDPATREMAPIGGFSRSAEPKGGHGQGTTSADERDGTLLAIDRTSLELVVIDAKTRAVTGRAKLAASPDYVRAVPGRSEAWVTEPDADQIEVFTLAADGAAPKHAALVPVKGGPEALVFDRSGKHAYTHLWKGKSVEIDVASRTVGEPFANGCEGSRGLALDEAKGILLAGCSEGRVVALSVRDHRVLDTAATGAGVDIIDFDPALRHVYAPGGKSATLAILGLSDAGKLTALATLPAAPRAHCVVTGGNGNVFVCDPGNGALLAYRDTLPGAH